MAVTESPLDMKIMKLVKEAEKGLDGLVKDIKPAVKNLHNREVDTDKSVKAAKKVLAFMGKFTGITKLQGSPVFKQLSPAAQDQVMWMDGLMAELLKLQDRLMTAKKQADFDPDKKLTILVKSSKEVFALMPSSPRGVGQLIKEIQKGVDAKSPEGALISILPMALLLWMIMDTILRKLKSKPRYG